MIASIYMGISLDGFVARADDTLDFLPAPPDGDDFGFSAFMASVDAMVMGRRTFDVVRTLGHWPYGDTPVIVLSRSDDPGAILEGARPTVRVASAEPAALLKTLAAEGARHVYVDGASTARSFLAAGLIDRIDVGIVPVLLGAGISLWGALPHDVKLELVECRPRAGGLVQCRYNVLK